MPNKQDVFSLSIIKQIKYIYLRLISTTEYYSNNITYC